MSGINSTKGLKSGVIQSPLYLVGTVHTDPDGTYRLNSLLKKLAPGKIFLEISEDRAKKILSNTIDDKMKEYENQIERWNQQGFVLTPKQRSKLLYLAHLKNRSYGFEVYCSSKYQKRKPKTRMYYVDIVGVDISDGLTEAFGRSQEPTPEVRKKVLDGLRCSIEKHKADLRRLVDFQYRESHWFESISYSLEKYPDFFERELAELSPKAKESLRRVFSPQRNEFLADGIRKNYSGKGISIAIMGASHLSMVGYLLSDLKPDYILLNEVPVPRAE